MSALFLKIVNMSISASWLVLAVFLLRVVLKKAPKWVSVLLWGVVAVRLICPFSFESVLSLIPSAATIPPEILLDPTPEIYTGIESLNSVINPIVAESFAPEGLVSMNPLQFWIPMASVAWLVGVVAMLIYTVLSYIRLRRKVATAVALRDNIFLSEYVATPFVLGIILPKIYLPFQIDEQNMKHVVAHEQAHIHRKDHWWKPLGFLLLSIHWFNPLMWLGYLLLCRDIELACDEKVIKEMDNQTKADYTQALVACSVNHRSIAACPLAFGEVGVKERVKSVMKYKKPAFWVVVVAIVICVVVAVCFLTNPIKPDSVQNTNPHIVGGTDRPVSNHAEVKLTEKVSDTQESSYRVSGNLQGTDLSAPGQILADKIVKEWNTYDGMTQQQKWTSSHLWGAIYIKTDTWGECEQATGIHVDNPLESVDWLNKTGYFGMDSVDPDTPVTHVQATAYATQNTDRKLSEMSVTAGYNKGSVHITLTATVSANAGTFTTGSVCNGYATYEQHQVTTGSGAPVLIVTTNEANNTGYYNGDYFDPTAYWVEDNVFYTLRVFGDAADRPEINNTLEQILSSI